jgi:hypothetical protein
MRPVKAAVGEAGFGSPDRLTDGQVEIVRRDKQLAAAHPELQQPRADVDECGPPLACQDTRIDAVVEIQEEVGTAEHRVGRALARAAAGSESERAAWPVHDLRGP